MKENSPYINPKINLEKNEFFFNRVMTPWQNAYFLEEYILESRRKWKNFISNPLKSNQHSRLSIMIRWQET